MVPPDLSDNLKTCPRCHQPLSPNVKFCEACGEMIEPAPACPHCGDILTPGVKFCETCGKPVGPQPAPPAPAEPSTRVSVVVTSVPPTESAIAASDPALVERLATLEEPAPAPPEQKPGKKSVKKSGAAGKKVQRNAPPPPDEVTPAIPPIAEPAAPESTPVLPAPEKPTGPAPEISFSQQTLPQQKTPALQPEPVSAIPETIPDKKIPESPAEPPLKTPGPAPASHTRVMVIAGILGILVIAALAFFVILPMISGSGSGGGGLSLPGVSPSPTTALAAAGTQISPDVSFELQPTQRMPANLEVTYQAERSPITGLVTVTFTGGPGLNGISQTMVTLTKSDGQVETRSFKPKQIGDAVTLQGTLKTDRIEVVTNFYNGDSYRVIDQLFEYKKKN